MRFFRNAVRKKKLPNELLESIRHMHSVFRGRAQKDVFEVIVFEEKKDLRDDVRCS